MGQELGEVYAALWQEVASVHSKWAEYVELYGTKESRVDLLNRAAPRFARLIQDTLWEDVLLHIARLTDRPESIGKKRNLSVQSLPDHIHHSETLSEVARLIEQAMSESEFCRDWRHRRLAHRDLQLALARGAEPLKLGSRQCVRKILGTLAEILNVISAHYVDGTTYFEIETAGGGALSLLYVIDDGLKAEHARRERLKKGRVEPDDYGPREI